MPGLFVPLRIAEMYGALARARGVTLPEAYAAADAVGRRVERACLAHPIGLAPCHNDAWPPNVVFAPEGGLVLVDWEYSGLNDPGWDLAHLSVECGLDPDDHGRLLHAYCGGPPPADLCRRVALLRGVSDVVWGLWALVQHADGNTATDFEAYAEARLRRAPTWW